MTMVLDESEEIPLDILKALLSSVRKANQDQVILFAFTSCFVLLCSFFYFPTIPFCLFKSVCPLLIVSDRFTYFLETWGESYRELFC